MTQDWLRTALVTIWLVLVCGAGAQQYVTSTVAGGVPPQTPVAGTGVSIGIPSGLVADARGSVFFTAWKCVFKLDSNGAMTRVAGSGREAFSGDGGLAASAQLRDPSAIAIDDRGNLFIVDYDRIRRVSASGIITTVAGGGVNLPGDGGPATSALISRPGGVAVDLQGNLFIAESYRIRRVSPAGIITTVAGNGKTGYSGDGGPATSAQLEQRSNIAVDGNGNLYIADFGNNRIRKVSADGIITTVAGDGTEGYSGDGASATSAHLSYPSSVSVDGLGNLFIVDAGNSRIRKVSADGVINTVAGNGTNGYSGDGVPAPPAQLDHPIAVAVGGQGNLFIAENYRIRKVSPAAIITTVAGNGGWVNPGNSGPATSAQLADPYDVAVDGKGNLFIADEGTSTIRKVSPDGTITAVAGNGTYGYSGDGGPATTAQLRYPMAVAVDGHGNLFIAEYYRVRKVSPDGIITTVAGTGSPGNSGDGGPAFRAAVSAAGLAVDGQGNLFLAEAYRIRKISPSGVITTVAGGGTNGLGDGGPATSAQLNQAAGLAIDSHGNLFIADWGNNRVRQVSVSGIISTVAGTGTFGYSGDGGPATSAQFWYPRGVAVDVQGNLFISDEINRRVRRVSPAGVITTIGGNGMCCYSGDGGPATSAQIYQPHGVAVDGQGNVYIADTFNNAIRRLQPTNQSVLLSAVVDSASQSAGPVSPGKIVVLYGAGLGPAQLTQNRPTNDVYSSQFAGTTVSFDGIVAPILYTSATQVAAIVPYGLAATNSQVTVSYLGSTSAPLTLPVAPAAPGLFTLNQTGAGQAAAVNATDGSVNSAANPVKIGGYISLFGTGEGQTSPAGVDGKIASGSQLPRPVQGLSVTVGGIPAVIQYAGAAPNQVAGLVQVNVQIPVGVQAGGYVPVVLQVGSVSTTAGAVWIGVAPD